MAAPAISQTTTATATASPLDTRWGRVLIPSLSDIFFCALLASLFGLGLGWNVLVMDGDTGWHIRTGEYILQNGSVPQQDIFSWSKPGEPWFAWEWLTDVLYALLHAQWGLGGVAVLSGLLICASAYTVLRTLVSAGSTGFIAGVMACWYASASSMHHHARPHVWTLLLFAITMALLVRDRRAKDGLVWVLVPLTCLWTNLHGGFLAAIALIGLTAIGQALEDPRDWRRYVRYLLLAGSCAAASVVNPYGLQLHAHVVDYLRSDFINDMVVEFKSPGFRSQAERQYEVALLLGVICAGLSMTRKRWVEALWVTYFAHMSLMSVRHAPLYMIVAAPVIAMEATRWWNHFLAGEDRTSIKNILFSVSNDVARGMRRTTVWIVLGAIAVVSVTTAKTWPSDFGEIFPRKMVAAHAARMQGARLFTMDQWGDYILYKLWPKQKVFVDGRSDFYGAKLGNEYLSLMNADYEWAKITERYGFDLMLVPVKWPLASVLKLRADWRIVADDGTAILFERRSLRK